MALVSTGELATNRGSNSVALTLFAPSGSAVGILTSNSLGQFTLPETGTYVIRVNASNLSTTGSYNLDCECIFLNYSPLTISHTCFSLSSGTIEAAAEVGLYRFSGPALQSLSLVLALPSFPTRRSSDLSVALTLFAPSGSAVGILTSNSLGQFTLPETGTYVIRVNASNLSTTGSYN